MKTRAKETEKLLKMIRMIKKAKALNKKIEELKAHYGELDSITAQLADLGFKSGHGAVLVDNFKGMHTIFRTTSVKRWKLEF